MDKRTNAELTTPQSTPITGTEVEELAQIWYQKLDTHAPLTELVPLLAEKGLKMVFPEMTVAGFAEFATWYDRVIHLFFDEVHKLQSVQVTPKADRAIAKVCVRWEASRWSPPAPRSERITLDAYQTWEVARSTHNAKPVILTYIVDRLDYGEGSARLD